MKWLKRITDYYKDKKLAEQCGLTVKDICEHESDGSWHRVLVSPHVVHNKYKCIKCEEFYR
jgi:hypothetical protein